jgi:3-oxoacyl-[acyl-carrier protein] reductase
MIELSLANRPAIVTGASSGIGREVARRFAEADGDVVICSPTYRDVERVATQLSTEHAGRVVPVECDVTNRTDVRELVDTAIEEFGEIRVLVNNVGGSKSSANLLHRTPVETFASMVELNLRSQFLVSKETLPAMVAGGGGSIVHMSSVNGLFGIGLSGYSEAKAGLLALSRNIATHYGQHGIRSNVLSPGTIETEDRLTEMETTEGRAEEDMLRDRWLDQYPLGRFGTPREVADATLFLASDLSSFMTGENIVLDGGLSSSLPVSFLNEIYDADEKPTV